jgi:hypothetical protein
MDKVGIELQLKSNLEQQLKVILPMLQKMDGMFSKMNKTLSMMESQQKKVNQQFHAMGQSIDSVTRKERGLQNIHTGVRNVGTAATGATRQVGMLGASLGGLMRTVAPLLGIYKLIQGVGAVGGNAVDFEKNAQRLKLSRYSGDEQAEIRRKALSLASSGKYTMNAAQNVDYAIKGAAISPDTRGVIDSMELMNRIDLGMRKLNVEDSKEGATGMLMNQIWEKMGDRTIKQKSETANLLAQYEGYYGGQVPLSQFSRQLQQSRGAKLGANKFSLFGELFHGISEQLTAGGGGGGMGGVGSSALALDRIFSQGIMSKQMIGIWKEAGMFPGIEEFAQHHKGRGGRSTYIDMPSGKHVLHNGGTLTGAGSDTYNKDVYHNYLAQKPPPWYEQAASDRIGFLQGPVKAGMERYFHLKPGEFEKQKDVEQKRMVGTFFYGATQKAIGEVIEIMTGRYEKTVKQQQLGVKGAKNLDQVLATSTSVEDRWAKMMAAFEAFGNALGDNKQVVAALNSGIDTLSALIKILNDNVGPIATWLTGNASPEKALMRPGTQIGNALGDRLFEAGQVGQHFAGQGGRLTTHTKSGSKDWAADYRKLNVPPPPPGMKSSFLPLLGAGLPATHGQGQYMIAPPHVESLVDANLAKSFKSSGRLNLNPPPPQPITIHNDIHLDGKKIGEHVSHHVERKQLKSAQKMNHAASNPGGSYSPKIYSHGVSH